MRLHLDLNASPPDQAAAGQDAGDVQAGVWEFRPQIDLNLELGLAVGGLRGESSRHAVSLLPAAGVKEEHEPPSGRPVSLLPAAGVNEERPTIESRTCRGPRNKFDGMPKMTAAMSGGVDRISQLPDELLHSVLSLLRVEEAVQTSVLARRWRHLWKRTPVLRLVDPGRFANAVDYDKFVNHLIALRRDSPLVTCEIESHLTSDDYGGEPDEPEPNPYFGSWIQYALSCKVQVLTVVGDHVGGETAELALPFISQHLTKLDVQHFFVGLDLVDFSSCPVLEDLKMQEAGFWVRKMAFPSLKRLCITECNFPQAYRVFISAPNLVSLQLHDCRGKTPLFESMPSLETASIELSSGCKDQCKGCVDENCEGCRGYRQWRT